MLVLIFSKMQDKYMNVFNKQKSKDKILLVIPILNPSSDFFETILDRISAQSIKNKIVLINSGDRISAKLDCDVRDIKKEEFNHANTRNIAKQYEADFYLFMTQDASPFDDKLIEKLLEPFRDENVMVSYAKQIPYNNAHITEVFARGKNYPENSIIKSKKDIKDMGIKTFFSSDSCAMYRGDYFNKMGGFKKDLNGSEDMEFAARAILDNKKVAYCAEAKVYHSHIYNMKKIYDRYFLIGVFFKENSWIEESLSDTYKTESTGRKQVLEEMIYILKNQPSAIFKSITYNIIKYLAYKVGKYHSRGGDAI